MYDDENGGDSDYNTGRKSRKSKNSASKAIASLPSAPTPPPATSTGETMSN